MEETENDMSNSTTLHIQNPPQYDVTIETKLLQSIFLDMYRGAARNVDAIIKRNNGRDDSEAGNSHEPVNSDASINTTIAFVGGRGTGKSSAMQSFSKYLQDGPNANDGIWQGCTNVLPKFIALPTIDSSQINIKETIIGRMSAAMLAGFREQQKYLSLEKKQEFLSYAKEVNELAVLLQTGEWFKSGDKLLTNTERICSMKSSVRKLVDSYLSIVCKGNAYLIITIDDLDMGIQSAHAIMEEIRQYLSIPRIVVLVSIDETLLDAVVKSSFSKIMGSSNSDKDNISLVKDLSYRYLEKLFPVNRRHHTPRLTTEQLREWKSRGFVNNDILNTERNQDSLSVRDAVLHLIWRKTMLIPVCNRDGDHLLIPRNLRSLCHMVVLLQNLPDIAFGENTRTYSDFLGNDGDGSLRENLRYNLNVFGKYIVDNLASYGAPQLSTTNEVAMASVLESVIHQMREVPLSHMNAMIVGDILYYVRQIAEDHDPYKRILRDVAQPEIEANEHFDMLSPAIQYPDSISLGDVMFVLGMLDSRSKCTYVRYLVEVIRTLWSIRMTEEFYVNGTTEEAIKENGKFFTTKAFRCAVGGSFVNPDYVTKFVKNGGWMEFAKTHKYMADFSRFLILYKGTADPQMQTWRDARADGGPYYKVEQFNITDRIWCNPFAIYTRILTEDNEELNNWRQTYIIALPFYSFDFMYRYYEEMHKQFRSQKANFTFWETLSMLLHGNDVIINTIKLPGALIVASEKRDEIANAFLAVNTQLNSMFIANSEYLRDEVVTVLSGLIDKLENIKSNDDSSKSLNDIREPETIDPNKFKDIRQYEEAMKEKINDLFMLSNNGNLSSEIIWSAKEPSDVYMGYDKSTTIQEKINAANEIKKQIQVDHSPSPISPTT